MIIDDFLNTVTSVYKTGEATEHSYRSALETLLRALGDDIAAINEPKRVKCGAPDFIVQLDDIAIGHLEAKDLDVDLRNMKGANKDQQKRYRDGLPNLIYTNCLDWDFYRDGELIASVTIADLLMGIQPKPDQFETLLNLLKDFVAQRPQTITSATKLAKMMAGKAVLIKDVLGKALAEDEDLQTELTGQYHAFKEHLIHDITPADFADIYAETIAYGMFAARLHDPTPKTFSRQEALELLPKSNPFLRNLFSYIAGPNLDDRLKWIIDDLARVFQACDLAKLMASFGSLTKRTDPFIHFYEDFLKEYNPKKRKARGVWYTPEPVVNFIVRAVDEVLQTEFGLPDGLADTSKVTIDWDTGQTDNKGKPVTIKKEVHRVQVLDPATGTGTFLAEVIKQVAPKIKGVAEGMWSSYIERDLIPRLHGFELLMASYAMCHMKLDMILTELGYKPASTPPRLSVYLTNSLEEGEAANQSLPFAQWLSNEVKEANTIKRDMPIMCVIGNPPYSGISQNMGDWIVNLIDDYKYVDGVHFGERKHWLHDDYVKFIRMSESLIEKNGEGVLGFITNHGYLDNPTFRGMRWHLMQTFDKIYILDLHGNSNKKEVCPDGSPDKNVFDIQQGVAIIIGVKCRGDSEALASVKHSDLWGSRAEKNNALFSSNIFSNSFETLDCLPPQYLFIPRDRTSAQKYEEGINLKNLMPETSVGAVTGKDVVNISFSKAEMQVKLEKLRELPDAEARQYFGLKATDARDWKLPTARADLLDNEITGVFTETNYRPFDKRHTFYTGNSRGMYASPQRRIMRHMLATENFSLNLPRHKKKFSGGLVVSGISGHKSFDAYDINSIFPLYLYPDEQDLDQSRRVNFDPKLYKKLKKLAKHPTHGTPDEVQVFDYIYGVLHCPAYRDTYREFLKIDFPRIPWPATPDAFWDISEKGNQLRRLHLMEPAAIGDTPYPFKGDGDGVVDKPAYKDGKVWINADQYFEAVPEVSWGFYIGGYQPAQKWLKDRKGRQLSFDDIRHYQRIIKILSETDRIMQTIEMEL